MDRSRIWSTYLRIYLLWLRKILNIMVTDLVEQH